MNQRYTVIANRIQYAPHLDDPKVAFERAIKSGALSIDPSKDNYAGNYMYMDSEDGKDSFKNITTRRYIHVVQS